MAPGDGERGPDRSEEGAEEEDNKVQDDNEVLGKENNQINPHRYNFLDLVDRPLSTHEELMDFIKSNQKWIQMKDRIQRRDK